MELDRSSAQPFNVVSMLFTNASKTATWRVRVAATQANLTAAPSFDSFSELVTNGAFATDATSWNTNLNGSVGGSIARDVSNALKLAQGTNSVWLVAAQPVTLKADVLYVLRGERSAVIGATAILRIGISTTDQNTAAADPEIGFMEWTGATSGVKRLAFTVPSDGTYWIKMREGSSAASGSLVDNISLADDAMWAAAGLDSWSRRHSLLWVPAGVNDKWIRIDLDDPDNTDLVIKAGRLYISQAFQPQNNIDFGLDITQVPAESIGVKPGEPPVASVNENVPVANFTLSWLTEAEARTDLDELERFYQGRKDVLVVFNPDATNPRRAQDMIYGILEATPLKKKRGGYWEKRFRITGRP
ncbi:MAG: hypothetical protein ACE5EM_08310 [Sphingomonadales bacterium]